MVRRLYLFSSEWIKDFALTALADKRGLRVEAFAAPEFIRANAEVYPLAVAGRATFTADAALRVSPALAAADAVGERVGLAEAGVEGFSYFHISI